MAVKYGFVRPYVVTDASVHDAQVCSQLIDGTEIGGDSAEWTWERIGFTSQIHNQPLTAEPNEKNRIKSQVRAKVEHVFGQWVMCLGG